MRNDSSVTGLAAGLLRVVRDEPMLLLGTGSAAGTVLAFLGVDKAVLGMLGALLSALLLLARGVVTPVGKVAETTAAAAREAAVTTAEALTEDTVGAEGALTKTGETIVSLAAGGATHTALKALGVSRKVRAKAVDG